MGRCLRNVFAIVITATLYTIASTAAAEQLSIAIDSGLKPVMVDIGSLFTRKTGIRIDVSDDASDKLAKAIENGKTWDLLLVADEETAGRLAAMGLVDANVRVFAHGRLAAVTATDYPVNDWQQWIRSSRIERIALPDPASSPHGREVLRALQALGLIERVRERLAPIGTTSEIIAEAQDGRAAIAFVPAALLPGPEGNMQSIDLPPKSYRLLPHTVAVTTAGTKRAPDASRQFADFLSSPDARDILRRHGYRLP